MTTPHRSEAPATPFSAWLRYNPNLDSRTKFLSCHDCDMWVHRYSVGEDGRRLNHIMLIEVKTWGKQSERAQVDTLMVVDQLLRFGTRRYVRSVKLKGITGSVRTVWSWGVHTLRMSDGRPDESEWLEWDGKRISVSTLEAIIRFDLRPDTMVKLETRRHHLLPSTPLFDRVAARSAARKKATT